MSLSEFPFFYVQIPSFCQLLQSVLPLLIWMLSAVYHFWSYFFWTCPGILLVQYLNVKQIHTALFYSLHGKLLLLEYPVFFMILLMFNMPYRIGNQHLRNFWHLSWDGNGSVYHLGENWHSWHGDSSDIVACMTYHWFKLSLILLNKILWIPFHKALNFLCFS